MIAVLEKLILRLENQLNELKSCLEAEKQRDENLIKKLEEENDFNEAINALSKTFKQTPFISLTLFQKLGKRLNYCPYKLMALHNMLKNNGDYFASFYDEEDGI